MSGQAQGYLNALKAQIANALNGIKGNPQPADIDANPADPSGQSDHSDQAERLNAVRHFNIRIPEAPPDGWVDIEDGMRKLESMLKPHERELEALLKPLAQDWIEAWLNLADLAARFNEAFDKIEQSNTPKNTQRVQSGKKPSREFHLLDRSILLSRKRSDTVRYQENILLKALGLIEECVERRAQGGDKLIRQLAQSSFIKNAKGEYSRVGMVRLRKIENDDPQWKEAMALIEQAEIVDGVSSYLLVSIRDVDGKYHPLPLDIASIRPYRVVPSVEGQP